MERLVADIRKTISKYEMLSDGDRVLAAVSGGPDSVALLDVLSQLQSEYNLEIYVFHLNHGLRKEADEDEAFVRQLVKRYGMKGFFFKKDVAGLARRKGLSVEEAGRLVRYALMEELARRFNLDRIALAHHLDDVAETFLMRLIKGASLEGLAGIPAVRGRVIRPLIEVRKKDIIRYLEEKQLDYRVDKTNLSGDNLRARVRNEIMPLIEEINPRFADVLGPNLLALKEDADFLNRLAQQEFDRHARDLTHMYQFSLSVKKELPAPLVKRMILLAILKVKGDLKGIKREHVERIYAGMSVNTGFEYDLPGRVMAVTEYGKLLIGNTYRLLRDEIEPVEMIVPDEKELKPSGLVIRVSEVDPADIRFSDEKWKCYLDADRVGRVVTVRSWKRGDRIKPLGMSGTRKVHDIFVDEKIPRRIRKQTPVLVAEDGGIAWVAGLRISEDYKITEGTERAYLVEVFRKE